MKVTILGSGTGIPHPHRASPGLVVELGDATALVDPSSGSLHRMVCAGLPLERLRWVVISHFHPDHTAEIVPLLFALRNPKFASAGPFCLIGPPGLRDHYRSLEEVYGDWVRLSPGRLSFQETLDGEVSLSGCLLRTAPVDHVAPSLGMRFVDARGGVLTYSGDSDYCPRLVDLARDADVAILEASHPRVLKVPGHLDPELAGRVAVEAGVKRLVITHMYPSCDDHDLLAEVRQSGFDGEADVAFDGMRITI
jgi:ribonuclease BN (tRNA processing enzyme)